MSRLRIALAVAAAALLLVALRGLPVADLVAALAGWVRGAGAAGVGAYVAVYVAACVALVPASLLTLAAGFVWGPLLGTAIVSPASVAGATAAFLAGRGLARARVERKIAGHRLFSAIDRAIGGGGLRVVLLLRLSPVLPFNLLNYGLGVTRVSLRSFVLGSFLGMLPGTFLYVYLGSAARSLADLAAGRAGSSPASQALLWAGLAATLAVTWLVTRLARRELAASVPAAEPAGSGRRREEAEA